MSACQRCELLVLKVPSQKSAHLARTSYVKEMTVAGLKNDFWKFWFGQKLGLEEDYHVSKNLSKIPTLRGPNCNLCGSIPPCFPFCNASYPYSRVYRPALVRCPAQFAVLCRSSCSCPDVNTREKGGILPRKLRFCPLRVGILERFLDTWESSSRPNFCPNQNFQKSIFKPATAISFREEMRASTPKFSTFFSRSLFGFWILKIDFLR